MAAIEVLLKVTQNETAYPVPPAPLCPGLPGAGAHSRLRLTAFWFTKLAPFLGLLSCL